MTEVHEYKDAHYNIKRIEKKNETEPLFGLYDEVQEQHRMEGVGGGGADVSHDARE